jgi:hypothetical protein
MFSLWENPFNQHPLISCLTINKSLLHQLTWLLLNSAQLGHILPGKKGWTRSTRVETPLSPHHIPWHVSWEVIRDCGMVYTSKHLSRPSNKGCTPIETSTGETPERYIWVPRVWILFIYEIPWSLIWWNRIELGRWILVVDNFDQAICYDILKPSKRS